MEPFVPLVGLASRGETGWIANSDSDSFLSVDLLRISLLLMESCLFILGKETLRSVSPIFFSSLSFLFSDFSLLFSS